MESNNDQEILKRLKQEYQLSQGWAKEWDSKNEPNPADMSDVDDFQEYAVYSTLKKILIGYDKHLK